MTYQNRLDYLRSLWKMDALQLEAHDSEDRIKKTQGVMDSRERQADIDRGAGRLACYGAQKNTGLGLLVRFYR